jgi:hypothetical protein
LIPVSTSTEGVIQMGTTEFNLIAAIVFPLLLLASLFIGEEELIVLNEWTPDPELETRVIEEREWTLFWDEARFDGLMAFNDLYDSYETKWSKNGRLMLRTGDSGPYRFVKAA